VAVHPVRRGVSSPFVQDVALATVLAAVEVVSVALSDEGSPTPAAGYALIVASAVPLLWRRRAPLAVWAVVVVATVAYALEPWPDPALYATALVAVYSVAAHASFRLAVAAGAATLVLAVVGWLADPQPTDVNDLLLPICATVAAWALGWAATQSRARLEAASEARRVTSRRAVEAERRRIARELHDLTAHHVSVIALQAEAGESTLAPPPADEGARRAFTVIGASARAALADLRRTLGLLRDDDPALRAPQPRLSDLPGLVDDVAEAGLAVELQMDVDGASTQLEDAIDLNAYRIVQEALTNVVKHASASRAVVRVQRDRRGLTIEVVDDGQGLRAGRDGFGLVGMRERVASCHGELSVDDAQPGVRVRAWFPA
jgi:signal transduction histidine kinase